MSLLAAPVASGLGGKFSVCLIRSHVSEVAPWNLRCGPMHNKIKPSTRLNRLRLITIAFALLFTAAAALSVAASILVTASLFISDRSPESTEFLGISLFVSGAFLAIGLLFVGIELQVVGIARLAAAPESEIADKLRARVFRLLVLLVIAGLAMCCLLGIMTYAILARIDQGFAVFG